VIRRGVDMAMRLMGEQFVTGQTIAEALETRPPAGGARLSATPTTCWARPRDGRGRGALFRGLRGAIHAIGAASAGRGIYAAPASRSSSRRCTRATPAPRRPGSWELLPRVARWPCSPRYDIGLNIDAEEADRLELSLDLLEALWPRPGTGRLGRHWASSCRPMASAARCVIDWIVDLARRAGRRIMVRLVKGAYWDARSSGRRSTD
jgi:RHH-type proline utilization regulon transcriptional repressor/proline dehydrogenase/delta 1-pyrroline-5-carboxylate dehydrogenase